MHITTEKDDGSTFTTKTLFNLKTFKLTLSGRENGTEVSLTALLLIITYNLLQNLENNDYNLYYIARVN